MRFLFLNLFSLFLLVSCSQLPESIMPKPPSRKTSYFNPIWIHSFDPPYESGNLPIGLGGPFINDDLIYSGDNRGGMVAYAAENGRIVWKKDDSGIGVHSSAIKLGDYLYYGTSIGRLISRHLITGDLKYSNDLGASIEGKPTTAEGRLFIHLRNHKLVALDAETGKILWNYKRNVPYTTTIQGVSRPLIINQSLYTGFADGFIVCLSVNDGTMLWEQKLSTGTKFVDVDMSPTFIDGKIVVGSLAGPLHILDHQSGKILRTLDYTITRAPQNFNGLYYLGTSSGEVLQVNRAFQLLQSVSLGLLPLTSLTVWKDKIVAANVHGKVALIDPQSMKILEVFSLGHAHSAVFSEIVESGGKLAIQSSRNRLYVFR